MSIGPSGQVDPPGPAKPEPGAEPEPAWQDSPQRVETPRQKVSRRLRAQGMGCAALGSPLYGLLLDRAADDVDAGGPVWAVLEPHASDAGGSALALRLMGAIHRLALSGKAPELAAHYPSTGGDGNAEEAWRAWFDLVGARASELVSLIDRGVQTNEVGRCSALLGGFLTVARVSGLPLRILEVGTSAGLNLRWNRFRYRCGPVAWGPVQSPVDLGDPFVGDHHPVLEPSSIEVVERRGCDVSPLDPTTDEGRLTLLSFVWPDQQARFANLNGACDLAGEVPVAVDRASGDAWVSGRLSVTTPGVATVVFHSIMRQYMTAVARSGFDAAVHDAGTRATQAAPLALLSLEPRDTLASDFVVRLHTWPGGRERILGVSHPHGAWVRWGAEAS